MTSETRSSTKLNKCDNVDLLFSKFNQKEQIDANTYLNPSNLDSLPNIFVDFDDDACINFLQSIIFHIINDQY